MKPNVTPQDLENEWTRAVESALQDNTRHELLGNILTASAGLHIQSGVQAGHSLWNYTHTSCTCGQTCDGCNP